MIDITFGPGAKITVKGHACFAPIGEDIVCAGISALVFAFAASTDARIESNKEISVFEAEPVYKNRVILDAVKVGCKMISDKYPENVRVRYPTETESDNV